MLEKDIEQIQSAEAEAKEIIKQAHLQIDSNKNKLQKEIQSYEHNKHTDYETLRTNLYKETDLIILQYKETKEKELISAISKIQNLAHAHSDKAVNFIVQSLTEN